MTALAAEDYRRFAEIIEWFLKTRGGKAARPDAPIQRWVRMLRRVAANQATEEILHAATIHPGSTGSGVTVAALVDLYAACATAHAIQIVEGRAAAGGLQLTVDGSFVTKELGASDAHARSVVALPAGVGTILAAADCARTLKRGHLHVFGNKSKGLDLEWRDQGATLRVEAKARSFATAFAASATDEQFVRWATEEVAQAGADLRQRCRIDGVHDVARVVRLTAFLPPGVARAVHGRRFVDALSERLARVAPDEAPHGVVAHWFGIDAEETDAGLGSLADSLPHAIEIPHASRSPRGAAVDAFYRMVGWPLIHRRRLRSAEHDDALRRSLLSALGLGGDVDR